MNLLIKEYKMSKSYNHDNEQFRNYRDNEIKRVKRNAKATRDKRRAGGWAVMDALRAATDSDKGSYA